MKTLVCILVLLVQLVLPNTSTAAITDGLIENPQIVGKARLEVMFWDIYDAELIAENGDFSRNGPFALKLTYLRDFDGEDIASRSVDEIRDLGVTDEVKLAKWFEHMVSLFPDVTKGNSLTGVVDHNQFSHFFFNDKKLGTVTDPEFSRWFFGIWLDENTSEPEMRRELLGDK